MEKKHSSPIFGQIPGSKPIRAIRVGLGTCGEVSMESVTPGVHPPWRKSTVQVSHLRANSRLEANSGHSGGIMDLR